MMSLGGVVGRPRASEGLAVTDAEPRSVAARSGHDRVSVSSSTTAAPTTRSRASTASRDLDWPASSRSIVVDNASGDGSAEAHPRALPRRHGARARREHRVRRRVQPRRGAGDRASTSRSSTTTPVPTRSWLRGRGRRAATRDTSIACVASKVLDWEGRTIDFVDAALSFYGHGFKLHVGDARRRRCPTRRADVLFASGAAMVMPSRRVRAGRRLRRALLHVLRGRRPRLAALAARLPGPLRARVARVPPAPRVDGERRRRGASTTCSSATRCSRSTRTTTTRTCARVLPAALVLAVRRGVALGGDDPHMLDLQRAAAATSRSRRQRREADARRPRSRSTRSSSSSTSSPRRARELQAARRRRRPGDPAAVPACRSTRTSATRAFLDGVRARWSTRSASKPASPSAAADPRRHRRHAAAAQMAGPGDPGLADRRARCRREHDVELVSTIECRGLSHPDFRVRKVNGHRADRAGRLVRRHRSSRATDVPAPGAARHRARSSSPTSTTRSTSSSSSRRATSGEAGRRRRSCAPRPTCSTSSSRGATSSCARARKQRDFWLGQLAAVGPDQPGHLRRRREPGRPAVTVVPFGVSDDAARAHAARCSRASCPGIGADDKVILWGGGVYNWFDPLTLLRAVDKLRGRMPEVRLFFLGHEAPEPARPRDAHGGARPGSSPTSSGSPARTCSSTRAGSRTTTARTSCSRPTSASARTSTTSRPSSRSAPASSTTSGPALPVVATGGDSFARPHRRRTASASPCRRATSTRSRRRCSGCSPTTDAHRAAARRAASELADEFRWSQVLAAARRVLPGAAPRPRPRAPRDGGAGRRRSLPGHAAVAHGPLARRHAHVRRAPSSRRAQDDGAQGGQPRPAGRLPHVVTVVTDRRTARAWSWCASTATSAATSPPCTTSRASPAVTSSWPPPTTSMLDAFAELDVEGMVAPSDAATPSTPSGRKRRVPVFAVVDAVLVPRRRHRARRARSSPPTSATRRVSFFSNDAGPLSFPSNHPTPGGAAGLRPPVVDRAFPNAPARHRAVPGAVRGRRRGACCPTSRSRRSGAWPRRPPASASTRASPTSRCGAASAGSSTSATPRRSCSGPRRPGRAFRTAWMTDGRPRLAAASPSRSSLPAFEREAAAHRGAARAGDAPRPDQGVRAAGAHRRRDPRPVRDRRADHHAGDHRRAREARRRPGGRRRARATTCPPTPGRARPTEDRRQPARRRLRRVRRLRRAAPHRATRQGLRRRCRRAARPRASSSPSSISSPTGPGATTPTTDDWLQYRAVLARRGAPRRRHHDDLAKTSPPCSSRSASRSSTTGCFPCSTAPSTSADTKRRRSRRSWPPTGRLAERVRRVPRHRLRAQEPRSRDRGAP